MKRENSSTRSPLKIVVTIVAIIVVLVYASAVVQINNYASGYSYGYDTRDYIYSAENSRFGNLYDAAVHDMDKNANYSTEVAECRALAFYYEQAVLEHAYRTCGDTAKADAFAKRMEEYEAQLGSMAKKTKAVHAAVASPSQ